ncbi:MAG: cell wall-active antibiotics response protein [Melioribacteraceae bacterium]|nr:cell wall-active antibiotics response protein [Melioribacteraceae bacterium]MCF8356490.1 cell wall-active antibiotics response protein [Melioribacteraceae bacterium]MCF8394857.1 cell wall-active antibiotics response protein [Melioribacteraceae bacterium]MCF8420585.1 cell wall-active antibiotics response protein [Melioribacteraceae bacterium]
MPTDKSSKARHWFGIVLIILGALFLLDNYNIFHINVPDFLVSWQTIFIIVGVALLFASKNKTVGVIFIAVGTLNLMWELWPLLLIGFGIYLIYRRNRSFDKTSRRTDNAFVENDYIDEVAIFGGGNKIIHSDNFKGGNVVAIFGGSELDLRDCKLAEGDCELEVTAIFGGTTLIVPSDWKVVVDLVPIFGGFGDERRKDPNLVYQSDRKLKIKGIVLFGGGEIKN